MANQQDTPMEQSQTKVQTRLTTRDGGIAFPQEPGLLFIPTNLKRRALSTLVNHLREPEKPLPLDFLVNGQLLGHRSLDEFLTANGLSSEAVLNIEYRRALVPPVETTSFEADDWISSVDVLSWTSDAGKWTKKGIPRGEERILAASYDGYIRILDVAGQVLATSGTIANGDRIKVQMAAKFISNSKFVSGGFDGVVRVFDYNENTRQITETLDIYGHHWSVEDIAVHGPSSTILAASSDNTITLSSTSASRAPEPPQDLLNKPSSKRAKLDQEAKPVKKVGALSKLYGHTCAASGVIFNPKDNSVGYSCSHDHSLRTWDLVTGQNVDTRTTEHALLSLVALPQLNLIAVGNDARFITMIDPRVSSQTTTANMTFRGHKGPVSSLHTEPDNDYGFISGSLDGTVRIWDVRTCGMDSESGRVAVGRALHVIERDGVTGSKVAGDGIQVYTVHWDKEVGIVSAGQDKKVQVNRAPKNDE